MAPGWYPNPINATPPVNSTANIYIEQVIGNKEDAIVEDFTSLVSSVVALVKGTSSRAARIETLLQSDFLAVPNVVSYSDVDNSVVFEVRLVDKETGPVPSAQITPGTIQISRWRAGVEQSIVAATPFSKSDGRIYYAYTFATASWDTDDTCVATPAAVSFTEILGTIDKGTILSFFDNTLALPVGPVGGDKYIALVTANGWTHDHIYTYTGGVWVDVAPATGQYVINTDDGLRYWFNGLAWAIGTITRYPAIPPWFTVLEDVSTLEGKVDAIQSDIGNPSIRTNLKSLEAMLGNEDAAGMSAWSQLRLLNVTAIDGSAVPVANTLSDILHKDGSYTFDNTTDSLEALADAIAAVQTDLGDPSLRTNLKTIEAMLGNPDTALMSAWSQIKALNATAIGAGNVPTAGTIADILHKDGTYSYSKATDSLEAIRDIIDGDMAVPGEDSVTDVLLRDVIGKKSDTVLGTSLVSLVKVADAAIDAIQTDLGDPSGRTNLKTILALLGNPDTAGMSAWSQLKILNATAIDAITVPVTNTLSDILHKDGSYTYDNTTDSLEAIADAVAALQADTGDPSARTNLKTLEAMLGNPDTAGMSAWSQLKALNATAIGAGNAPTAGTLADILNKNGSYTFSKASHSLEALRDAIDVVDGLMDVPAQNETANTTMREVIGNKTDTTGGTSLVSLVKIADAAVDAAMTELETATLDAGDGSIADHARLGEVVRYIIDNCAKEATLGTPVSDIYTEMAKEVTLGVPADTDLATDILNAAAEVETTTLDVGDGVSTDNQRAGLLLRKVVDQTDKLAGEAVVDSAATQNWNSAEANIVQIGTASTKHKLHSLFVSIAKLTAAATITIRMYHRIAGIEIQCYEEDHVVGTDVPGIWLVDGTVGIHDVLRVTAQSDNASDDGIAIDYSYMLEAM